MKQDSEVRLSGDGSPKPAAEPTEPEMPECEHCNGSGFTVDGDGMEDNCVCNVPAAEPTGEVLWQQDCDYLTMNRVEWDSVYLRAAGLRLLSRVAAVEQERDESMALQARVTSEFNIGARELRERAEKAEAQLAAKDAALTEALRGDRELSDAYLRIRALVGAWDTQPGGADRFQVTEQKIRDLKADVSRLTAEGQKLHTLYYELLYEVGTKHPDETRHQTALRYLRTHENQCGQGGPVSALAASAAPRRTEP